MWVALGSLVGIALYFMMAWALYQMALKESLEYPWIAFIPVANFYILGKLVKDVSIGTFNVPSIEYVLPAGLLLSSLPIPGLRFIIAIAFAVLLFFVLSKLYKMYSMGNETLYAILSIVLPFLFPVFLFLIKDKTPTQVV